MTIDANANSYNEVEDLVDLRAVWVGLRRRAGLFAAVATTTFLAVVAYVLFAPSLYTAETSLMIEPKTEVFGMGEDVFSRLPADPQLVDTEVELLRSRGMAIRVANRLFAAEEGETASASTPATGRDRDFLIDTFSEAANDFNQTSPVSLTDDGAASGNGAAESTPGNETLLGEDVADAGDLSSASEAGAESVDGVENQFNMEIDAARQEELQKFQSRLEVARVGTTFLIKLRYTSPSPEQAARVANAFAEEYILQQVESQFAALNQANRWIDSRLAVLRKEVRAAEEKTGEFRAEQGLMEATGSQSFIEQRINALAAELAEAKTDLASANARYNTVRSYINSNAPLESIGDVMRSTVVMELRRQQAEITRTRAELTERYGPLHPELKKVNTEFAELQAQIDREVQRIVDSLRADVNFAASRVRALETDLDSIQGDLFTNNNAQVNLLELERDLQASRGVYEALLNRQKELNERDRLAEANARIVARAEPPDSPSQPRKKILLAGGLVLALLFGGGASFAVEALDTRIRNTGDMRKEFGPAAPVVLVPRVQARKFLRACEGDELARKFVTEEPNSLFAESMRDLRVHLKAAEGDAEEGVAVAFTSAFRNEGKSTTAISFATLLANSGRRVAFLDCASGETEFVASMGGQTPKDLKITPSQAELADMTSAPVDEQRKSGENSEQNKSITDVDVLPEATAMTKSDDADRDEVSNYELIVERRKQAIKYPIAVATQKTGVSKVDFTSLLENPHNDFNAKSFALTLADLRKKYDYIVIDAPALLPRAEASNIAAAADFAVMVTEWCATTRGAARVGVQRLVDAHAQILSFVVNKVDEKQRFYFRAEDRHFYYRRAY